MSWSGNADFDIPGADIEYRYFNLISDYQAFVSFSRKYQHPRRYLQGIPDPALK
jgi:hypothetical protein